MTHTVINSLIVIPDWCTLPMLDDDPNAIDFCVTVHWRGAHRYAVSQGITNGQYRLLSRQGTWKLAPEADERDNYHFTLGEAMCWARRVVNHTKVAGHTYEEWERHLHGTIDPAV